MKRILLFTILFLLNVNLGFSQCDSLVQRNALMDLYNSTGGSIWKNNTNWLSEKSLNQWYGIQTDELGCITDISLRANLLLGKLPSSIGNFVELKHLDLSYNIRLTQTIPDEIKNLQKLEYLDLDYCKFYGSVPKTIGSLVNLKYLNIANNQLSLDIPSEYGNLIKLEELNLSDNGAITSIPESLSNLQQLKIINLSYNRIKGNNVLDILSNLSNLEELKLDVNLIKGSIPVELAYLPKLTSLNLRSNQLSGCIPDTLVNKFCGDNFSIKLQNNIRLPFTGEINNLCTENKQIGAPCNDEDSYTINDRIQENCNCKGNIDTSDCKIRDHFTLIKFYNDLDGDNWTKNNSWGSKGSLNTWYGIKTNSEGCVTKIDLRKNNLTGEIPKEIGQLSELKELILYENNITGNIPKEIGQLSKLMKIDFGKNQLSGNIPPELGNLTLLKTLNLYRNNLDGEIPKTLTQLTNLSQLSLFYNKLTGKIPIGFGKLKKMTFLSLHHNQLSGSIPKDFGEFSRYFGALNLSYNQITGSIPIELANLEGNLRVRLDLSHNQLTGTIPPFGKLYEETGGYDLNFHRIALNDNKLTGSIPASFGDRSLLLSLYLQNNNLSECFPPEVVKYLCQNSLDTVQKYNTDGYNFLNNPMLPYQGDIDIVCHGQPQKGAPCDDGNPDTIGDAIDDECNCNPLPKCRTRDSLALMSIYASTDGENWIENDNWGSVKYLGDWYGVRTNLDGCVERLDLTQNQLSGEIPKEIGDLDDLKFLFLSENDLIGEIPKEIGDLQKLKYLHLNNNQLSSNIPSEIGDITSLFGLNLSNNQLSGSIPKKIGKLSNLTNISLYDNQLSGSIPTEISKLPELSNLALQNNQISGSIPQEIGQLSNLIWLNLSHNQLTGKIPSELSDCPKLEDIRLSNNNLTGSVPEEIGTLDNLNWLYLDGNNFFNCIPNNIIKGKCEDGLQFKLGNNPLLPFQGDLSKLCNDVTQIGAPCDDGDASTPNDKIDENCLCNGKTVATNDIKNTAIITISPNPASDYLHFEIKHKNWLGNTNIVFYNLLGEEMRKLVISDASDVLDYRIDIPRGVYFCRVGNAVLKVVISE